MKIKKVKCDQFAGLTDRTMDFSDGLNIILGENESGKSTTADLIYRTLFKQIKLSKKSSSDVEFMNKYFPSLADGSKGDNIDGTVEIETEDGTYRLSKEWKEKGGSLKLQLPNGLRITDEEQIIEKLSAIFPYGEGIYDEIVFASQKRMTNAIKAILSEENTTAEGKVLAQKRTELTELFTKAVNEIGGVDIDKLEQQINDRIEKYILNWDESSNSPRKGSKGELREIDNQWAPKNTGDILASYYEKEILKKNRDDAKKAEDNIDECNRQYKESQEKHKKAEEKRINFLKVKSNLDNRRNLEENQDRLLAEGKNLLYAQEHWPDFREKYDRAVELKRELENAKAREEYKKCLGLKQAEDDALKELEKLIEVNEKDLGDLKEAEHQKQTLNNKLKGMNIAAKIKKLGDADIEIRNAVSSEIVPLQDGYININDPVVVSIPGIMEMEIAPQDVNMDRIREELAEVNGTINKICQKYSVSNSSELSAKKDAYFDAKRNYDNAVRDFKRELGVVQKTWEQVQEENDGITGVVRCSSDVSADISKLCDRETLDSFMGGIKVKIDEFKDAYTDFDGLVKKIEENNDSIGKVREKLDKIADIPDEFKNVNNTDEFLTELEEDIKKCEKGEAGILDELRSIKEPEQSSEAYEDELKKKTEEFESRKAEYQHWKNIKLAFDAVKSGMKSSPEKDVKDRFEKYLGMISDGRLKLANLNEKLSASISSGKNKVTFDTLSAGTVDTITLAFRLAMLEHLFPDGGGLAVFDDPFTEMSPERTKQSCKLLQEFAKNNQVIFITCDEKYKSYLEGNVISIS